MKQEQLIEFLESNGINPVLLATYYPNIGKPLGKPSQLDITPREFFYWTDKGVIDIPKAEVGQSPWSKLNLFEILWIRIVKELREFNLPFAPIAKLKNEIFMSLLDKFKANKDFAIEEVKAVFSKSKNKDEFFEQFDIEQLNDDKLRDKYGITMNLISALISDILIFKRKISLIVCKENKEFVFLFDGNTFSYLNKESIQLALQRTHLIIDLNKLLEEYVLDSNLETLNEEFGLISEDEKELLKLIRDKQIKEIQIKRSDDNQITYSATSKYEIRNDNVAEIKKLLRMNEFDDVRVVLRNDKHLYIENKKKIKIRPVDTARKKNKN
jgi:hypothetical protein